MIRAVVDSNVLASGLAAHDRVTPPVGSLDVWRNRSFTLVVCEHVLAELARTLQDRYFRRRLTPKEVAADLSLLRRQATIVTPTVTVSGVATHPEDDLVLAAAVPARVNYLVTGDVKLHRHRSFAGVTMVSPREFLDILQEDSENSGSNVWECARLILQEGAGRGTPTEECSRD